MGFIGAPLPMIKVMLKVQGGSVHPLALGVADPAQLVLGILTLVCLSLSFLAGLFLRVTH